MNALKQCRHGLVLYNPNDLYIGKAIENYGEYSEHEVKIFKEIIKPDDWILDIGANIGTHTLAISRIADKGVVMAYEPQRMLFYNLCANIALNSISNVYCFPQAFGRTTGVITVPELDMKTPGNFGALELNSEIPEGANKCQVKMVSLDSLNLKKLNFIKMDVEGMELEVLLGGKETINKHRPIIYAEADRFEKCLPTLQLLTELNYKVMGHFPTLYNEDNYDGNTRNLWPGKVSANWLCVPFEMYEEGKFAQIIYNFKLEDVTENKYKESIPDQKMSMLQHEFSDLCTSAVNPIIRLAKFYSEVLYDNEKSSKCLEQALSIAPNQPVLYSNLANVMTLQQRYPEALTFVDAALNLEGETRQLLYKKSIILGNMNRIEEAIGNYEKLIEMCPEDSAQARFNMGWLNVLSGDWEKGYKEMESRFKTRALNWVNKRFEGRPFWSGEDLKGKTIILFCEQGTGDLFNFIRYAPQIKEMGAYVILECKKEEQSLTYPGVDKMITHDEPCEDFDYIVSIASLPYIFGTNQFNVPSEFPYIYPGSKRVESFLGNYNKYKVGLVWSGSPLHENDFLRSMYLREFRPISEMKGVQLFSLYKSHQERIWKTCGKVDLTEGSYGMNVVDITPSIKDWNDTAHALKELDLLVTVDTGIAHLAGALGMPVVNMLGKFSDCRWLIDVSETPWYPSMTLLRAKKYHEWTPVIQDVKKIIQTKIGYS
jgi:FkbM family methyltransferase